MTGTGLAHLSGLPQLKLLKFVPIRSDSTLVPLRDWPALEALNLANPNTSDSLLATLGSIPRLKSLSMYMASITDNGLASLQDLQNLEELDLAHTRITDQGLEHVVRLDKLRLLMLGSYQKEDLITVKGIKLLSQLPRLEALNLTYVKVDGGELQHLAVPTLRRFNIDRGGSQIREDLKQLQARLPNLESTKGRFYAKAYLASEFGFGDFDFLNE